MKYLSKLGFLFVLTIILSSCQTTAPEKTIHKSGFKTVVVKGGDFWITTLQKITDETKPYVFYIEGDGAAFISRTKVSLDPTPKKHMLLNLAAMDKRPNVIYVARPCQYTPMHLNPKCNNHYWTDKRMSDDSAESINKAINSINNGHKFSLIGFSGGGGIAVLVAARNPMTHDIISIAANLDHATFTDLHKVTPMTASLNPIKYAKQINKIPQLHLSGGKDKIVPDIIAEKFVKASASRCVKQKIYKNASHNKGWEEVWKEIYTTPIKCN